MKRIILLQILLMCLPVCSFSAVDSVKVWETQVPFLIEREDNALFYIRMEASGDELFQGIDLTFDQGIEAVQEVKLYYGGTKKLGEEEKDAMRPVEYLTSFTPHRTLQAIPSYSSLKDVQNNIREKMTLKCSQRLFAGTNFFWVSVKMKPNTDLSDLLTAQIRNLKVDGRKVKFQCLTSPKILHRMGVGVRHAGDDGVSAYRIPGLVTTLQGTLLGVYDVRHNNSVDLQEWVEIGISRSTDGGRNWEKMRIAMQFGETDGLPKAQNGVGDPSILVDRQTGDIWVVAAWTQGIGNQRAWFHSGQGMTAHQTAQLVMTRSQDDGKTWSRPINVTSQVKRPEWFFLLQGPGRGISMENGTLVFPIQFIGEDRIPNAGVMYSEDHGKSWHLHHLARTNTTEAQVVELSSGELMLNMRDNRGGSRAVAVTDDLGRTWREHPSSRKALPEPVCMASLLKVKASENILGRDLMLFSNPNSTKERRYITLKASLDEGMTWPENYQIMLDEESGWGYTCLTLVDRETIGILYESSVAQMTFQTVKIKELIPMND